jgi:hypothetical protein
MKKLFIAFMAILLSACSPVKITQDPLPPETLIPPTATVYVFEPTDKPPMVIPTGYKVYKDSIVGVSIFVPESWIIIEVTPGQLAYLQSYPEDKYVGGEGFKPGDTKCDFHIRPLGTNSADLLQNWKADSIATIVSEEEITLQSGIVGTRIEIDNRGLSLSYIADINERVVVLSCYEEFEPFDEIVSTISVVSNSSK